MRTANLTGAQLDYWTARAEGVAAADLEFRAAGSLCVRVLRNGPAGIDGVMVLDYSTNWALSGPLVEKWSVSLDQPHWYAKAWKGGYWSEGTGDTPLIAICRAVVHAAFGDEVEDLPC
jgi:hypothetical protein